MAITATIHYNCGGCDAKVDVEVDRLDSRFHGVTGHEYGFGHWDEPKIDVVEHCPEGWMAFDPYTRCCYCPGCVEEIWPDPEERGGMKLVIMPTVAEGD